MAATHPDRRPKNRRSDSPLEEIHRRLVAIHYPLAEALRVDEGLHHRTLERLMVLLRYVEEASRSEQSAESR